MNSKEEVIKKVLEGTVSLDELQGKEKDFFESEEEINDLEKILTTAQQWQSPHSQIIDSSWNQILNRTAPHKEKRQRGLGWLPWAAVVSLILMVSYFINSSDSRVAFESGIGEIRELSLPDGTGVTLNALSSISYNENWDVARKVWLSGKARFDVARGTTFEVITEKYVTTVLGTSFDVSYEDETIEVSCYSGKVEVSDGSQRQILTAGERAFVENGKLVATEFNVEATRKWITGEFYFENAPFEKVVNDLTRIIHRPPILGLIMGC